MKQPLKTSLYPIEQSFKQPMILTALFVLIPSLLIFLIFGESDIGRALKIFFGNWISPIILWFFAASFFHLWLKSKKVAEEQEYTNKVLSFFKSKNSTSSDPFLEQIKLFRQQENIPDNNLLLSRAQLYLNHHGHDANIDEAFGIKERELLRSSYALSRFMVWAIPIIGFIGTVWGISNGIAHFSDAMTTTNSVTDASAMLKESLPLVTNSLATAFDTTLLALLLSVPLMMMMLWLEKQEEAYLIALDEAWFHDIKPLFGLSQGAQQTIMNAEGNTVMVSGGGSDETVQAVADEIKLLSTQIGALQETMEDLYESTFSEKLDSKNGE
ncbi:MAG: MotA/TolQ/ExbB proton channel family protein [Cocleimonas sp.]|nr:MotA/TolQ/ExbB proton channel family protein [Cocleimonas sp.]